VRGIGARGTRDDAEAVVEAVVEAVIEAVA
jgi:hypothetical protein